jgi:putative ABC transport system permease protein
MLENLWRDLQYAVRGLKSKPGFTIAVIATLGLGIGANAAMFGIVDRLLFRPPPMMKDFDRVHRTYLYNTVRGTERTCCSGQFARYKDFERLNTHFEKVAAFVARDIAVGVGDEAREMRVAPVSSNFFTLFDAPPVLGRYFTASEDSIPSGQAVAVLSNAMWKTQYGSRKDVLGTSVQIGPLVYTVIGVAPPGFVGLWPDRPPSFYIPIVNYAYSQNPSFLRGGQNWWTTYSWGWLSLVVLRKADVPFEIANADMSNVFKKSYDLQLIEQTRMTPAAVAKPRAVLGSYFIERGPGGSNTGKVATWVGGVSLVVLLIACANVANLLLARALRRQREIAVRLALGVSRGRLVAQLLTESVVLAACGGVAGLLIANWGGIFLRSKFLDRSEAPAGFHDLRTVVFVAGSALLVGVLTGLAPVFQSRRVNLASDLKAGAREGTHGRSRLRTALLVFQGALSVLLLVGAGLFVRSLHNVQTMSWGYDVDPVLLVTPNMRGLTLDSARRVELYDRLAATARTIPGVVSASLTDAVPYWSTSSTSLFVQGIDTVGRLGQFNFNKISPEHFATLGTRILRGRGITADDRAGTQRVMVASDAMAKVLWPGRDAIGQCIRVRADTMPCTYVVGIAENIKAGNLETDPSYYYYLPVTQDVRTNYLFVRTRGDSRVHMEAVRRRLQSEMPGTSYIVVMPFTDIIGPQKRSWNLGATMFTAFGVLALVLSAIGLYSVIAYNVTQRMHELGVRRALGAQGTDVVRLVVGDGVKLVGAGVIAGIVAATWAGKFIKPLLFGVSPRDPAIYAIVALVLVAAAVAASWVPALRASRVDPSVALRSD